MQLPKLRQRRVRRASRKKPLGSGTFLIPTGAATCRSANGEEKAPGPSPSDYSSPALTGAPSGRPREKIAYVTCSRGREDIEAFVESVADLSQIQNRTGDRNAAVVNGV
jgi:hypothetical protein